MIIASVVMAFFVLTPKSGVFFFNNCKLNNNYLRASIKNRTFNISNKE